MLNPRAGGSHGAWGIVQLWVHFRLNSAHAPDFGASILGHPVFGSARYHYSGLLNTYLPIIKKLILINVTGRIWPHSLGTLGYYPARYSLGFKSGAVDQFQSLFGTGQLFLCALGLLESSVEAVDQPDGHISREGETNGSLNSLSPWIESQNQQWDHMLLCRTVLKNEFGVSPLRNPPLRNAYKLGVNVIGRDPPFHLSLHSLPNADRKLPWTLWSHVYLFWRVTLTAHCGLYLGSRHQSLFWGGCRVCDY